MSKQKACKNCRAVYSGAKCPKCGSEDGKEGFKGVVKIFSPEQSEIAQNLKIKEKGDYAIKL